MSPHHPFRPSIRPPFGSASRLAVLLGASLTVLAPHGLAQAPSSATPARVRALAPAAPGGPGSHDWPAILDAYESAAGQTYFKSSNTAENDGFGAAVAIDGSTMLISSVTAGGTGAVYVFTRNGSGWTETGRLMADGLTEGAGFGSALALDGDHALVGASGENEAGGAAYAFVRDASGNWTQQARIAASDVTPGDRFYILSNDEAINFRLFECPLGQTDREHWVEVVAHRLELGDPELLVVDQLISLFPHLPVARIELVGLQCEGLIVIWQRAGVVVFRSARHLGHRCFVSVCA